MTATAPASDRSLGAVTTSAPSTLTSSSGAAVPNGAARGIILARKTASGGGTTTALGAGGTGGPELYGYRNSTWYLLDKLNVDAGIDLTDEAGWSVPLELPGVWERLAVKSKHADTDPAAFYFVPVQE